jgi:hypothetical protein
MVFAWLAGSFRHDGSTIIFCLGILTALAIAIKMVRSSSPLDNSADVETVPILYCPQCGHKDPGSNCRGCGFQIAPQ